MSEEAKSLAKEIVLWCVDGDTSREPNAQQMAELSALIERHLANQWQPIETAPRDGTRILVYVPDSENVLSVYWDAEFTFRYDEAKASVDEKYAGEHDGAWTDDAVESFAYEEKASYSPTHWMPLPDPPKETK